MKREERAKEERIARLNQLKNLIEMAFEQGREIDKKKLISYAMFNWGLSYRTCCEYVEIAAIQANASIKKGIIVKNAF